MEKLQVTMLGGLSIRWGENTIGEAENRMKKIWLLLAYLIYARKSQITQRQFLSVIQGADTSEVEDPAGRLKALFYRARSMLDQSRSVVFEWDLSQDQLRCSERWEKRFGYPVQKAQFSQRLEEANHFHPDDLPLLRAKAQGMLTGTPADMIDLRIANSEGRYFWSRIRATTIQEMLAFIGVHFNVSRVYIFENNADNTSCSNTFEWCNAGIQPEMHNLQNISYITDIPGWFESYDEQGILYCTDIQQLSPLVRAVVEPQNIKSMLQCTILDQGQFRGFIGFDECTANHLWTQGQVSLLKQLSAVFSVFVTKLRRNA